MNLNIKMTRIKRGIKQEELSKMIGVSRSKLSMLENGNFSNLTYPLMFKISKALGVSVQELFFDKEN
ncbi:helix-turn-helix transcriptional regulator [Clostridium thermobutyricum]|uniref:Antitoxin HipB n=1 Tax=Clostridium thermobutyricum DSM 4928 TaxID=1121339 RepID=A0A1V4T0Z8_9CLOT|nr:helix-turn-helix transcriptional regulator [Clostridium thermobutyricum]OPX50897.1 antitoxin HipB [Clostridium thermobutyricum DSM 4928]